MWKPEPLKGKAWDLWGGLYEKKDIRSAVEWLKKELKKEKDYIDIDKTIDQAFEDVMK